MCGTESDTLRRNDICFYFLDGFELAEIPFLIWPRRNTGTEKLTSSSTKERGQSDNHTEMDGRKATK